MTQLLQNYNVKPVVERLREDIATLAERVECVGETYSPDAPEAAQLVADDAHTIAHRVFIDLREMVRKLGWQCARASDRARLRKLHDKRKARKSSRRNAPHLTMAMLAEQQSGGVS